MAITISTSDTSVDLIQHATSGETYIARYASTWDDDRCIGSTITALVGPLHHSEWQDADTSEPRADWLDYATTVLDNKSRFELEEDVEWANSQEWRNVVSSV